MKVSNDGASEEKGRVGMVEKGDTFVSREKGHPTENLMAVMDELIARELLFKKMNGELGVHSVIVREAVVLLNEQRQEINRLNKELQLCRNEEVST